MLHDLAIASYTFRSHSRQQRSPTARSHFHAGRPEWPGR